VTAGRKRWRDKVRGINRESHQDRAGPGNKGREKKKRSRHTRALAMRRASAEQNCTANGGRITEGETRKWVDQRKERKNA